MRWRSTTCAYATLSAAHQGVSNRERRRIEFKRQHPEYADKSNGEIDKAIHKAGFEIPPLQSAVVHMPKPNLSLGIRRDVELVQAANLIVITGYDALVRDGKDSAALKEAKRLLLTELWRFIESYEAAAQAAEEEQTVRHCNDKRDEA